MLDAGTLAQLGTEAGPWVAFASYLAYERREIRRDRREERGAWKDSLEEQTDEIRGLREDLAGPVGARPAARADGGDDDEGSP